MLKIYESISDYYTDFPRGTFYEGSTTLGKHTVYDESRHSASFKYWRRAEEFKGLQTKPDVPNQTLSSLELTIDKPVIDGRITLSVTTDLKTINQLIILKLADTWFKPIIEPRLPRINSHGGKLVGDVLSYGCALFNIHDLMVLYDHLNDFNAIVDTRTGTHRTVQGIMLNSFVAVSMEQLEEISEVYKHKFRD